MGTLRLGSEVTMKTTTRLVAFIAVLAVVATACSSGSGASTIAAERAENASFSDSYFSADQSLLVLAEMGTPKLSEFGGKKIGVQSSTTGEAYAKENAPADTEIVSFESGEDLFLALTANAVDAILQDLPVNGYRAQTDSAFSLADTFTTDEQYGFAMAKGSDLVAEVNKALKTLRDNGTYGDLHEKYFGTRG